MPLSLQDCILSDGLVDCWSGCQAFNDPGGEWGQKNVVRAAIFGPIIPSSAGVNRGRRNYIPTFAADIESIAKLARAVAQSSLRVLEVVVEALPPVLTTGVWGIVPNCSTRYSMD